MNTINLIDRLGTWSLVGALLLTLGCQRPDNRARITIGKRSSAAALNKAAKNFINEDGCPDLLAMKEFMTGSGKDAGSHETARWVMTDLQLSGAGQNQQDPKLLAQVVNASSTINVEYAVDQLAKFAGYLSLDKVIAQDKCATVKMKESDGRIQEYQIAKGKSPSRMEIVDFGGKDSSFMIEIESKRLGATFVTAETVKVCGRELNLLAKQKFQLSYGQNVISEPILLGENFAKMVAEYSTAGETFKESVQEALKKEPGRKTARGPHMKRMVPIHGHLIQEAYSRVKPKQMINIDCNETRPTEPVASPEEN